MSNRKSFSGAIGPAHLGCMDRILLISPDKKLSSRFKRILEDNGFLVLVSPSLESSFLEVTPAEPFLVLVDRAALPEQLWQAQKFLGWFHHRSPVWLLCPRGCPGLKNQYDRCISKGVDEETLLACIRELRR